MKKILVFALLVVTSCIDSSKNEKDVKEIHEALDKCALDWSNGDIDSYMDIYWKSDKLQFISKSGMHYGWKNTLENYKKKYPTLDHTGILNFKVFRVDFLSKNLYSVSGEYFLIRKIGNLNGVFTLIFKKIDGKWVIVSDHTE